MKYYNKDYGNYINDDSTEVSIDKEVDETRQIDEEYKKIEKSGRLFRSPIDIYRERHNGYPSNLVFFVSLLLSAFILFVIFSICTQIIDNLNLLSPHEYYSYLMYSFPIMLLAIFLMLLVVLHFIRPFVQ